MTFDQQLVAPDPMEIDPNPSSGERRIELFRTRQSVEVQISVGRHGDNTWSVEYDEHHLLPAEIVEALDYEDLARKMTIKIWLLNICPGCDKRFIVDDGEGLLCASCG